MKDKLRAGMYELIMHKPVPKICRILRETANPSTALGIYGKTIVLPTLCGFRGNGTFKYIKPLSLIKRQNHRLYNFIKVTDKPSYALFPIFVPTRIFFQIFHWIDARK